MVIVAGHIQSLLPDHTRGLIHVAHTHDHIQGRIQEVVLEVGHVVVVVVDQEVCLEDVEDHVILEVDQEVIQKEGQESTPLLITGQSQPVIQHQKINKVKRR